MNQRIELWITTDNIEPIERVFDRSVISYNVIFIMLHCAVSGRFSVALNTGIGRMSFENFTLRRQEIRVHESSL